MTPSATKVKKPKPARGRAFGILNPWGDVWTYETFETEGEARAYIAAFWLHPGFGPQDLSKFKVVPVRVVVSVVREPEKSPRP